METRKEPTAASDVITLSEAAEYLKVSVQTARRLVYAGELDALKDQVSGRIVSVTVDSVWLFDHEHPDGISRKNPWTKNSRLEPHIYREHRKDGMAYRVKVNGAPGRTFSSIKPARMYRDKVLSERATKTGPNGSSASGNQSLWSRLFGWLGDASKSPTE
jgi:excisionase family DNA binding protein